MMHRVGDSGLPPRAVASPKNGAFDATLVGLAMAVVEGVPFVNR
jgi:hypothetical protein